MAGLSWGFSRNLKLRLLRQEIPSGVWLYRPSLHFQRRRATETEPKTFPLQPYPGEIWLLHLEKCLTPGFAEPDSLQPPAFAMACGSPVVRDCFESKLRAEEGCREFKKAFSILALVYYCTALSNSSVALWLLPLTVFPSHCCPFCPASAFGPWDASPPSLQAQNRKLWCHVS